MDILLVALTLAAAIVGTLVAVVAIVLMLAACIEMVTAGRVSFDLGNGRLWRRVCHGRTAP